MFGTIQPTSFDLRFRMFGIPVAVHPLFWLVIALFGQGFLGSLDRFALWMLCGFVSILLHEMGHALAFSFFGRRSFVYLYGFGGLASPEQPLYTPWKRLVTILAGPAVTFSLSFGSFALLQMLDIKAISIHLFFFLHVMFAINLFWGILNMFPIWPLDGGQAMRETMIILKVRQADNLTHTISFGAALFLIVYGVLDMGGVRFPVIESALFGYRPGMFGILFLSMFAMDNWQRLQQLRYRQNYYDDSDVPPWRRN